MEISGSLSSSCLQLMLFLAIVVALGWLLGRYLVWLYRDTMMPSWLSLPENFCGWLFKINLDDERLFVPWLKLCAFSIILTILALACGEWHSFRQLGIDNLSAFKMVPWEQLINTAISYFTNTGWSSSYHAALEGYLGQIMWLIPINLLGAALWISLAVMLTKSLFSQEHTGYFNRYLVRTIIWLLLPLWGLAATALQFAAKTLDTPKVIAPATLNYAIIAQQKLNASKLHDIRHAPKARVKANRWRQALQSKPKYSIKSAIRLMHAPVNAAKWATYQAANLITANGRTELCRLAKEPRPIKTPLRVSALLAILIVLSVPAGFTFLVNYYTPKKQIGRTILVLMLTLFSIQFLAIAVSQLKTGASGHLGTLSWLSLTTSTATSLGDFANLLASASLGTQFISMISLIVGNLVWGSSGLGLITMLCYLSLTEVWTELMIAKNASFSYQALKLPGTLWLTAALSCAGFIAMALVLPHLRALPSTTHSLSKLMPLFFYYLSMLQGNGAMLPFTMSRLSLNLGSFSMLLGLIINSCIAIFLINRFSLVPPRTKRLNLVAESPARALNLLIFIIVLNGLNIAPILLLGPIFW